MNFSEIVEDWVEKNLKGRFRTIRLHENAISICYFRIPSLELGFAHNFVSTAYPNLVIDLVDGRPGAYIFASDKLIFPEDPQFFEKLEAALEEALRATLGPRHDEIG